MLEEINDEFNKLISQKQTILLLVKDFQKKITLSIEEINLPSLKKYIETSLSLQVDETCSIPCIRCKKFVAKSKSSLAAHQKGKECLKIFNSINNVPETIDSNEPVIENELVDISPQPITSIEPLVVSLEDNTSIKIKTPKVKSKK
jgi:hypothetical protein